MAATLGDELLAGLAPDLAPSSLRNTTLGRVLDHLGSTVLTHAAGDVANAPSVSSLAIYDPVDEQPVPPGALVLAVGVQTALEVVRVIDGLAGLHACAVVVREPVPVDAAVRAAAARAGVVVLGVVRGAAWTQLARLLAGLLASNELADADRPETIAGLPAGDLFAVANAISSLLDAPVTIEDRSSRVLAFSGRQDEADPSRIETIIGRQVPQRYTGILEETGAFRRLYRSTEPILVDLSAAGLKLRAAVAVRAGDEILGSIWAVVDCPLSPARETALQDAANLVAMHMLRLRAGADVDRRLRAELVATALEGGSSAAAALARLGLAGQPVLVLALDTSEPDTDDVLAAARREADRLAAADALSVHLSAVHARAAVALLDGVTYALVPVASDRLTDGAATRVAEQFLERIGSRIRMQIGVGRVADTVEAVARSRCDAERVLQVLHEQPHRPRVARLADVHLDVLLLDLAALAHADRHVPSDAVARISEYDETHNTDLLLSLRAWLDGLDAIAAAARMRVHVNTFRYRLRRIAEITSISLDDPDVRFALSLELRLLERMRAT